MAANFVDFKIIKEQVSMEMVLGHYGINLRRVNQTGLRGKCPLPTHTSEKSIESFSIQLQKNIWACQSASCAATRQGKKGGNVIDFVAIMESCSIRDAALKMNDWFSTSSLSSSRSGVGADTEKGSGHQPKLVSEKKEDEVNRPLSFVLHGIDPTHSYLSARGILEETSRHFGVGFFSGRGTMAGRVVIPISNERGELVAYAGRAIDDAEPKYKFPTGFKKAVVLFNLHGVRELSSVEKKDVIVVEGFFDCLKVWQSGFLNVVALMGSSLSKEQQKFLCEFARVVLFLDGDEAGRTAARDVASILVHRTFVKIVNLPDGKQPDQLSSEEIKPILGSL